MWLFKPSIRAKLLAAFITIGIALTMTISSLSYFTARNALEREAFAGIQALRESRINQIRLWLDTNRRDVAVLAENPTVVTAYRAFRTAIDSGDGVYGQSRLERLNGIHSAYINQPDLLDAADQSIYSAAHHRFHPFFAETQQLYGYEDILLTSITGEVLYSVAKHSDFASNLYMDGFKEPILTEAIGVVLENQAVGFSDMVYYEPAGKPIMVLGAPVYFNNTIFAVLLVEVPAQSLNEILLVEEGLGQTGETYIVGKDGKFRTQSRFVDQFGEQSTSLNQNVVVDTKAVREAFRGNVDTQIVEDYRGERVLSAWSPLVLQAPSREDPEGIVWAIVIKKDYSEVVAPAQELLVSLIAVGLILILGLFVVAFLLANQISRPIRRLTQIAERVSMGDLDEHVEVNTRDEVGILAEAFNSMTIQLRELIDNLEERVNARTRDLEIAANVTKQVAAFLEPSLMLSRLAEITRAGFGLYHVSVFLYDDEHHTLKLAAATGPAGDKMLLSGESYVLTEQGLVVTAARTRQAVLANDVKAHADYLALPELSETQSELALPMIAGKRLIGVLDLQSQHLYRFSPDDLRVMSSLGEQIAIAVRNAQLFAEVREARLEAERANRVKSSFLATMSHELRTPLNGILNFTRFVADGMFGPVNEKQQTTLLKAVDNGKHLLALINDILDISKIESGSLRLFVEDNIRIENEMKAAVDLSKTLLVNKPVLFQWAVDENLPAMRGDRRRIRQIFVNIVSNACKFTETGTITLKAYQVGDEIVASITDTGPGILEQDLTAVFEIFMQTDTGIRQGEGTGLGMPISKRLAEAHGGRMWLESTHGEGSTFYVALPIKSSTLRLTLGESHAS